MQDDIALPPLSDDLPWERGAYLLLDGVSAPELVQHLVEWAPNPQFEMLYQGTRYQELLDLSPCLIQLDGSHSPILRPFLEHAADEWGYLLFSAQSPDSIAQHLRWLLSVQLQQGELAILRLADPAVIHALLTLAQGRQDSRLFGPIEQICAADVLADTWHQHQRPGQQMLPNYSRPYVLSEAEQEALAEVSIRQSVLELSRHMRRYFPAYGADLPPAERLARMQALATEAYQRGYGSAREIAMFANLFGYLGDRALDDYPDLARLLGEASDETPAQRLEQAAHIAQQRAASR